MADAPLPNDKLRVLLDGLAEDIVTDVLKDIAGEVTRREKTEALKTASQWWIGSRKGQQSDEEDSAWEGYRAAIIGGKGKNGKAHSS